MMRNGLKKNLKKMAEKNDNNIILETKNFDRIMKEDNYSRKIGMEEEMEELRRERALMEKKKKRK